MQLSAFMAVVVITSFCGCLPRAGARRDAPISAIFGGMERWALGDHEEGGRRWGEFASRNIGRLGIISRNPHSFCIRSAELGRERRSEVPGAENNPG